jgi:hypothetical protein
VRRLHVRQTKACREKESKVKWPLVLFSAFFLLSGCASVAPVPENISYVAPHENIGEIGKFIGAWHGTWEGALKHNFYVLEVTPASARVILSWAALRLEGINIKKGYKELQGDFIGKDLFVKDEQEKIKAEITYRLNKNGTITAVGKFELAGRAQPYDLITVLRRVRNNN